MPGRVYELYHGGSVRHVVDVEFFRSWLRHPRFRLNK
jgi:hypothetical protein